MRPSILTMFDQLEAALARGEIANARLIAAELRIAFERPTGEYAPILRADLEPLPEPIPDLDDCDYEDTVPIRAPIIERGRGDGHNR